MCFLWITIDNKPWHEYTDEFRRDREKLDTTMIREQGINILTPRD